MKLNARELSRHLEKRLASCYLVSGDEPLLVDEALDAIRATARERGFGTRERHVATTGFDWSALAGAAANLSLFAERRIVELHLPTGKPGQAGSAAITEFVGALDDDVLFIVSAPKLDRRALSAKWCKALDSAGATVAVWPVERRELPAWVAGRMRLAGLQPDREAAALIADRVEGNLLAAAQEIEKLRLLLGEGKVDAVAVGRAVADSSRFDVFRLVDAAVAGERQRVVRIMRRLQAEGVQPVLVGWALGRELRTLAALAEAVRARSDLGSAMRKNGVWRNREGIVRACLARHRDGDFLQLLALASRADAAARGRHIAEPWAAWLDVAVALAGSNRQAA